MSGDPIQIVTIYSASQSTGRHRARRVLAMLSLLVAIVWLVEALYPSKVFDVNTIERWVKGRLMFSSLNQAIDATGEQQDPWVTLGLAKPKGKPGLSPQESEKEKLALQQALQRRMTFLWADFYVWKSIAGLAGAWLAFASLIGLTGRPISIKLHRQAAWLMILSTAVTIGGIEVAIRYGGMPANASTPLYLKIAGIQSGYAWFLLIATRWMR